MKKCYLGILAVCFIAATTFGAVTFEGVKYKGYIDLTGLADYSNNNWNVLSGVTATKNEIFVSVKKVHDTGSTLVYPNVFSIGMPEVGDSVSEPVRMLGTTNHPAGAISVLSSQGNDLIFGKYKGDSDKSFAWTEDVGGGNLNTNVTGDGPGDDRQTWVHSNWRDGRSATLIFNSTSRDNGPPIVEGYFLNGGPVSWTNSFGDQIDHGKMAPIHEMRGHFPRPASHDSGVIENGKTAYLYTVPHDPEGNKVYIEAGEVTWDDGKGKWMVPTNAEASFAPCDYVPAITNHGIRITIANEMIYALDAEDDRLYVFDTTHGLKGAVWIVR